MKVHTTETQQQFKPITLHIEIESKEEFEHLMMLFQCNVSVPAHVYKDNYGKQKQLEDIMGSIHEKLAFIKHKPQE